MMRRIIGVEVERERFQRFAGIRQVFGFLYKATSDTTSRRMYPGARVVEVDRPKKYRLSTEALHNGSEAHRIELVGIE